jgi:hypothetical protein
MPSMWHRPPAILRSSRRLIAGVLALSLGLGTSLMPAGMLASELHPAVAMQQGHMMVPCHTAPPCAACKQGEPKNQCEGGSMCAALCSPILLRVPHEISVRAQLIVAVLRPANETAPVSLFPDPPKRPPRAA